MLQPKKAKLLISEVAKDLGVDENLVKCVVDYYWQEVRKNMSELTHQRIHILNLGDFVIKHWNVEKKIKELETFIDSNKRKNKEKITERYKLKESLEKLYNLRKLILEEKQRADFIKMHRNRHS